MKTESNYNQSKKEIRNLLIVIGSGVVCALLLSLFLILNYGPSGRYQVSNILLSPELTSTLSYNDTNSKTGGSSRFIFENIMFNYYDANEKKQKSIQITPEQYAQLYQIISSDKSILEPSNDILNSFGKPNNALITIKVRTESHAAWQDESRNFQEFDLSSEGDFYRIALHDEKAERKWIYFQHNGIFEITSKLLIPAANP
jgi:hypothetical protein